MHTFLTTAEMFPMCHYCSLRLCALTMKTKVIIFTFESQRISFISGNDKKRLLRALNVGHY